MKFKVRKSEAGERADLFLVRKIPKYSRAQIQQAIESGAIKIGGKSIKASYKVRYGNIILIDTKFFRDLNKPTKLAAEKIPLEIIYEDKDLIAINKPAGLVVHPAAGNIGGTLVSAILNYYPKISSAVPNKSDQLSLLRPGIIHRLDKETSGILLVAKNRKSLIALSKQLQDKKIKKKYLALVFGWPPERGVIKSYLSRGKKNRKIIVEVESSRGKEAILNYKIEKYLATSDSKNHASLLEIEIPTGRTHQIRVQLKGIGYPVIGDETYNTKESKKISAVLGAKRQMLHAAKIRFQLPSRKKYLELSSPLPEDFQKILNELIVI